MKIAIEETLKSPRVGIYLYTQRSPRLSSSYQINNFQIIFKTSITSQEKKKEVRREKSKKMEIGQLPEECISHIISFTSARDACRSSLVSPLFRSAADSDVVWEKFLPSDYKDFISQSVLIPETTLNAMRKKRLYFHLCNNPITIGNGNMVIKYESIHL